MKTKFQCIIKRNGDKFYAFSGSGISYRTEDEILERIKKHGRSYPYGVYKAYEDFTKEELKKEIEKDMKVLNKQPVCVFEMFKKHFGIDLYNMRNNSCLRNPDKYPTIFTEKELKQLKDGEYRNYWHFVCEYVHMCPRVATINFAKMLDDIGDESERTFWIYKITKILHKTFGDKNRFYFSKWNSAKPKVCTVNVKY